MYRFVLTDTTNPKVTPHGNAYETTEAVMRREYAKISQDGQKRPSIGELELATGFPRTTIQYWRNKIESPS